MKKFYFTILALACFQMDMHAQYSLVIIDGNNVEGNLNNGGVFFNDPAQGNPGYEYPKGSGKHLIYANSFWFQGEDINGNKKISAQLYNLGDDLFPGALKIGQATVTPNYDPSKGVYQITKSEIDDHIANYSNTGYITPSSISDWPAHGDPQIGQDFYLAPFIDVNNDGFYTPSDGDYPKIRGDYATYMILNDKLDVHASGGDPIGIECHFMFYQYNSSDFKNNTTFLNLKVINRTAQSFPEFNIGCFLDPDLGNSSDDYVGCDTTLNTMYSYNFSNNDAVYGNNPPTIGVVNLNQSMDVFGCFKYDMQSMMEPNIPSDYFYNLDGYWKDGTPYTVGGNGYAGNVTTKYLFSGNPNNSGEWSEIEAIQGPGERKMFMATEQGPLSYGEEICLDYAFIIGDGGDHLENVNNLLDVALDAQNFFDTQEDFICENYEETLDVDPLVVDPLVKELEPNIYPVPSNGQLTIKFLGKYIVEIHSLDGRKVFQNSNMNGTQSIYTTIESGSYIISVIHEGDRYTKPIIIR